MQFKWGFEENTAFKQTEDILASEPVLGHYDESKKLILTCDASSYGVGCILSQPNDQGLERPIAYHSRTQPSDNIVGFIHPR